MMYGHQQLHHHDRQLQTTPAGHLDMRQLVSRDRHEHNAAVRWTSPRPRPAATRRPSRRSDPCEDDGDEARMRIQVQWARTSVRDPAESEAVHGAQAAAGPPLPGRLAAEPRGNHRHEHRQNEHAAAMATLVSDQN